MREKLIKFLDEAYFDYRHGNGDCDMIRNIADHLIAHDIVPLVHGQWHKYKDHFTKRHIGWICSNCSAVSYDLSNGDTTFCPHCGALMDLDEEDDNG